ncbi:2-hydroxyacid dehydrogenase [Paucibacter sp. AS339]|uniref:2-hydroxyacid dehydrogenase n=1 Tax=Paucibacter hankyongi TaxID=3133434 RepID=UPI0030981F3A
MLEPQRPALLILIPLPTPFVAQLAQHYRVIEAFEGPSAALWLRLRGQSVGAVLSNGSVGLSADQMDALPGLRLVSAFGAGYESIDLAAARQRGIQVSHAPGINNATVADHALMLMLALARGIVPLDRAVKSGAWLSSRTERPTLNGRRLGLVGIGNIGQQIARRASGFDMDVAYHARSARLELAYRHEADLLALAEWADYLVLACPGGTATRHLIKRPVLQALGPQGFIVNIARGSVLHTGDLIAALQAGEIAGAGLDVLEGEPEVPAELCSMPQVLLTPHVSGRSPEAQRAQLACLMANLAACFAGQALPNAVPN